MRAAEAIRLTQRGWSHPWLPALIYRGVVPVGDPDAIEASLDANGWRPDWRDGVYPFHHYHSTAHEGLACVTGLATLILGGEGGRDVTIAAGDLVVLPAGTGHRRVEATVDFMLVGAYSDGQSWDVCREAASEQVQLSIAGVALPDADPVDGGEGALTRIWRTKG